jgi:hypothetical protein
MMIFIYCNWVSTRWQLLVDLYKNKKETAVYKRINNKQTVQKHRIHKLENKLTNRKTNIKRILYNVSRVTSK